MPRGTEQKPRARDRWLVLFAHGAGAPSSSPWMRGWAKRMGRHFDVVTFDYPYMREGRKSPDRAEKLIEAHREALRAARRKHPQSRVALIGKSMGSRIGCHVAALDPVDAIVCLGYPLVSPGNKASIRDEALRALTTPILFVQGTRDPLCPLDLLASVRKRMTAPNEVYVVESGNHSLEITATHARANATTQTAVDEQTLARIVEFLASPQ